MDREDYEKAVEGFAQKYQDVVKTYSDEFGASIADLMESPTRWAFTDSFPFALTLGNSEGLEGRPLDREQVVASPDFRDLMGRFVRRNIKYRDRLKEDDLADRLYEFVEYGHQLGVLGISLDHLGVHKFLRVPSEVE